MGIFEKRGPSYEHHTVFNNLRVLEVATHCTFFDCKLFSFAITFKPRITDIHVIQSRPSRLRTVFFVPGESPCIFSKFNPLNADTFYGPFMSVLTGFDGT